MLQHTLALDFTYIRLNGQSSALETGCTDSGPDTLDRTQVLGLALAPCLDSNRPAVSSIADPFGRGTVRVLVIPIGCAGACGVLAAGSRRLDFPTEAERALLGVGANQAAIILQHRRAEEVLRQSEARFASIFDQTIAGVAQTDLTGRFVLANQRYCETVGRSREELLSLRMQDLTHPADLPRNLTLFERMVAGGANFVIEKRYLRPDGSHVWVNNSVSLIRDANGHPQYVVAVVLDVSERKEAEAAQRRLAAIVEFSQDAIISKTLDGIITNWNTGAEHIFGYTADELVGRPISLLIPPERQDEELQINERLKRGERIEHFDTVRVRKDSRRIDISLTISPIRDETGRIVGASKIARDITDRKRIEEERAQLLADEQRAREEAEATTRAKDEFVAVVSHELRSPLNAIYGWVQVLAAQEAPDPAMVKKAIGIFSRNIEQQRYLIDDLLDTARMASGKLKLEIEPLDLVPVTSEALDVIRPAAEAKGVELFTVIDSRGAQITGDALRLQQVIWNLLSNAVKFTPAGGRIELRLERLDPYVRITVSDTGCGIAPEFLPYLFDRFRQADSASTRRHGGLGLGMALVKHVVELHGGTVRAQSAGFGQRACLTVDLPVRAVRWPNPVEPLSPEAEKSEVNVKRAAAPADSRSLESVRVLVVDDQDEARELVATVLEGCGASVMAVGSGREALALLEARLEREPPEVLICDIAMPEEDGYCMIRKLRVLESERGVHLSRRIPAIALTAFAQPKD
ncbi:MAG: PAS domain S-box protein, partial [Gammaproteobacteria bacterium]